MSESKHPLERLSTNRDLVIEEVVRRTSETVSDAQIDELLTNALFWERKRLEKPSDPIRDALDEAFWRDVSPKILEKKSQGLLTSAFTAISETLDPSAAAPSAPLTDAERVAKRRALLQCIIRYHAEEISGNFNSRVYSLATKVVPQGFGMLLQGSSLKSFGKAVGDLFRAHPNLRRKIHIQGEVEQLRKLSKLGTVMLVPTHFSNIDSMLIGWILYDIGLPPFCYGAGLNLFTNPAFGYFMNNLGAYKVDRRKNHELYKKTLKMYSTTILEHGCHTIFFPGGGRSRSGGLEKKLKLGLLGTAIDAYIENLLHRRSNPNIYIVPCVTSYHFVLEASTLIGDFLSEQGKNRFIIDDDESSHPKEVAQFLYKFFKASSSLYVNIGRALDPFGNFVNDQGQSIGNHGQVLDLKSYVTSNGSICASTQRDHEYTSILGNKILNRYRAENIALTSHFIPYAYFEYLREKIAPNDIFKLFRLKEPETQVSFKDFAPYASKILSLLHSKHERGELFLEPALRSSELKNILEAAVRNVGVFHTARPIKTTPQGDDLILSTEDMKLLFYYHNRMEGYGLSARERGEEIS